MKLKKFISSALALSTIVTSLSVVNVFAADPTFAVGAPIDALTGEEVTEFTAGQIIELPIDVNTDSGTLANIQIRVYYDNSILDAGINTSSGLGAQYLTNNFMYRFTTATDPTNSNIRCGRHNMLNGADMGTVTGNCYASDDMVITSWNITAGAPQSVNVSAPEFYVPFTVKSDFDASKLGLNAGTNSLNSDGIFGVEAEIAETVGTAAVRAGEQKSVKANACDGAFKIVVKDSELPYYVQGITLTIDGKYTNSGETENFELDACESAEGEGYTEYSFPVRLISAKDDTEVVASIKAKVSDDLDGNENPDEVNWGSVTVSMTNPKTYATATGEDYTGPVRP